MNTSDKIKLTAEIASRLISSGRYLDKMGCVELAKEIIEESEKIYIHEYQSTKQSNHRNNIGLNEIHIPY